MNNKSCGGCCYFQKLKGFNCNSGLCEWHDCRTDSDCGHNCEYYKSLRYNRNKEKLTLIKELEDED